MSIEIETTYGDGIVFGQTKKKKNGFIRMRVLIVVNHLNQ